MNVSQAVRMSKAGVVFFEIGVFKEAVGGIDGADPVLAQGFDQTVLMGAVTAFDTSFGLR